MRGQMTLRMRFLKIHNCRHVRWEGTNTHMSFCVQRVSLPLAQCYPIIEHAYSSTLQWAGSDRSGACQLKVTLRKWRKSSPVNNSVEAQRWLDDGPASPTLGRHRASVGPTLIVCWFSPIIFSKLGISCWVLW